MTVSQEDYEAVQTHAEQATVMLALVLKHYGGSVYIPKTLIEEGFNDGESVELEIDDEGMRVYVDG